MSFESTYRRTVSAGELTCQYQHVTILNIGNLVQCKQIAQQYRSVNLASDKTSELGLNKNLVNAFDFLMGLMNLR